MALAVDRFVEAPASASASASSPRAVNLTRQHIVTNHRSAD